MKKNLSTILLVLIFFIGLSIMLYPTVSDDWKSRVQSRAIADYEAYLADLSEEDYAGMFGAADAYNAQIRQLKDSFVNSGKIKGYDDVLNINSSGIMGYITIEKIGVKLPIYHGTSDAVLNAAVGHLEGSSLPVGGQSTHAVLSAHRGLPSAKLFTDLDKLELGDTFQITVLNRVLTYEVDQIQIVEPTEISELYIRDGEDHCTLITCTPYGINTHRLLVRGTRIETILGRPVYITSNALRIDPIIVAPVVAAPILLVLLIVLLVRYRKKR